MTENDLIHAPQYLYCSISIVGWAKVNHRIWYSG